MSAPERPRRSTASGTPAGATSDGTTSASAMSDGTTSASAMSDGTTSASATSGSATSGSATSGRAPSTGAPDALSYEQARDELGDLVRQLESGGTGLEESLRLWERGEHLVGVCQQWLDGARVRLEQAGTDRF